jgi:hypothetical protein
LKTPRQSLPFASAYFLATGSLQRNQLAWPPMRPVPLYLQQQLSTSALLQPHALFAAKCQVQQLS